MKVAFHPWRLFVVAVACWLWHEPSSLSVCGQECNAENSIPFDNGEEEAIDIAIIGAGMAGISLAKEIKDRSNHSFVVFESTGRIGGRMRSEIVFGDEEKKTKGYRLEWGANWLLLDRNSMTTTTRNVENLANQYNLVRTKQDFDDVAVFVPPSSENNSRDKEEEQLQSRSTGYYRQRARRWRNAIETYYEQEEDDDIDTCTDTNLQKETAQGGQEQQEESVMSWMAKTPKYEEGNHPRWSVDPNHPIDHIVKWAHIDYIFADKDTAMFNYDLSPFMEGDFIYDQESGYEKIPQRLATQTGLLKNDAGLLKFNHQVTLVNYSLPLGNGYEAAIYVKDPSGTCRFIKAKRVATTVSIGVLSHQDLIFDPPLKMQHNPFVFKLYQKVFIQFQNQFWPNQQFILTLDDVNGTTPCRWWQNWNMYEPESNVLLCTLVGYDLVNQVLPPTTTDITRAHVEALLTPLQKAFPNADLTIQNYFIPPIRQEKSFGYGSYSNWPGGKTKKTMTEFYRFHGGHERLDVTDDNKNQQQQEVTADENNNQNKNELFGPLLFRKGSGWKRNKWIVHVGGTCSCLENWELVHGAHDSGIRTAKYLLASFHDAEGDDPYRNNPAQFENPCDLHH